MQHCQIEISSLQLASNALFQVNIIGVMTGTEIALERMKKVLGSNSRKLGRCAMLWVEQRAQLTPPQYFRLNIFGHHDQPSLTGKANLSRN